MGASRQTQRAQEHAQRRIARDDRWDNVPKWANVPPPPTPAVLGLDVSPLRLGWGLVSLDDGTAIACGMERIDLPHRGWMETQITEALKALPPVYVAAVYIEQPALPPVSGTKSAYNAGRAIQAAHTVVRKRWPEAAVEMLQPGEWRKLAGLPGSAKKDYVWEIARGLLHAAGQSDFDALPQDAADALLCALAGQRLNVAVWDQAQQREMQGREVKHG